MTVTFLVEHETVWIQIRPYLLSCDFVGPDLGLNCMQNLPADETFGGQSVKHSTNCSYCIYDVETLLVKK